MCEKKNCLRDMSTCMCMTDTVTSTFMYTSAKIHVHALCSSSKITIDKTNLN